MKRESGRINILLLGGAALMQAAGFLILHHLGILQPGSFWQWCFMFL